MNPYLSAFLRHAWRFLQGVCRISWHLLTAILTFIERFVLESAYRHHAIQTAKRIVFGIVVVGLLIYIFTFPGGPMAAIENLLTIVIAIGILVGVTHHFLFGSKKKQNGGGGHH
jgi:hypothetical protein